MPRCPNCGRQVGDEDTVCSFCEKPLNKKQNVEETTQPQQDSPTKTKSGSGDTAQNKRAKSGSDNDRNQANNQPLGKGGQGGQSQSGQPPKNPRQSGQQQSGQRQGGQPQGSYDQSSQDGSESPIQALQRPGPMRFLKVSVVLGALGGLVFGIMMVLIGKLGGFPMLPSAVENARDLGETQTVRTGQGAVDSVRVFDAGVATTYETSIAYLSAGLAPFLAFGLAVVVGVLIATRLDGRNTTKLAAAGTGMFAGGFLLVVVSAVIIAVLGPSIPDVLIRSQIRSQDLQAVATFTNLSSPQLTNIFLNALFTGAGSAATAAVTVFSLDEFMLD